MVADPERIPVIVGVGQVNDRPDSPQQGLDSGGLMIAALKAGIAHYSGDAQWATVRPPLLELTKEEMASLTTELQAIEFDMPGLKEAQPETA